VATDDSWSWFWAGIVDTASANAEGRVGMSEVVCNVRVTDLSGCGKQSL
jgi:hypothetical protein